MAILAQVTWPWAQPLDGSIWLKFLLETRLKSRSFAPLIGFVAFLVQELNDQFYVFKISIQKMCRVMRN